MPTAVPVDSIRYAMPLPRPIVRSSGGRKRTALAPRLAVSFWVQEHLSTGPVKALRSNGNLGIYEGMGESRIVSAMTRIDAALERMASARSAISEKRDNTANGSSSQVKILALVNSHEKLREEVAETLSELDSVIAELER
ncbi:hypothetical protein [Erythrobacter ani]|uniref:Uncharacterized protein n=1 Tax=Erythrobacter ani TaxID=2827235 RepID=A0ABS6SQE2_9SPHN|nr:hypothetical protein [Erythrobacter ani]MBV7267250.1 hypothetical protein [Erythrobacter ani]